MADVKKPKRKDYQIYNEGVERRANTLKEHEAGLKTQDQQKYQNDIKESGEARRKAREEGRQYMTELWNRPREGLRPDVKNAMQYEANQNIRRELQSANRNLLGEQGRRGIVGRGGVGYAQQRDLRRMAQQAQGQSNRDIEKLDADMGLKHMAAMFAGEQGEASQAMLDRQLAMDALRLEEDKRRAREYEKLSYQQFTRL